MLWSILICGIPERYHSVQPLLYSLLETQAVARRPDVHLEYKMDNKRVSVGAKRNSLLQSAIGEYISFIDDDDEVAPNYVDKILSEITKGRKEDPKVDVICFPQRATLSPSGVIHECSYSLAHKERKLEQIPDGPPNTLKWTGPPAHTMVWRREIVRHIQFPEKNFGEDVNWVDLACGRALKEAQITGEPLYFYKFSEKGTATR